MSDSVAFSIPAHETCKNCGEAVNGDYCAACGQRHRGHDMRLWLFISHLANEFFHWDSKLLQSLWLLIFRPGRLTKEWIDGKERSYVKPLQLFFFVNIIYFVLQHFFSLYGLTTPLDAQYKYQSYSGIVRPIVDQQIREKKVSYKTFESAYDRTSTDEAKTLVIVMVPMFALLMSVLYIRKKHYYVEHLIFALHFYAFFLIVTSVLVEIMKVLLPFVFEQFNRNINDVNWDMFLSMGPGLLFFIYILKGLKHVYGGKATQRVVRAIALSWSVLFILWVYRFILFFTTIYTMSV